MNIKKYLSIYKGLPKDIYLLFISIVINKMGSFIMPLLTLILAVKIGLSKTEVGLFSTIAMLTQVPFIILGGNLVDKFGGKKIIVFTQIIGSLVYLGCGFMKLNFTVVILIIIASDIYAMASPAFTSMVPLVTPSPLMKNAYSLIYLGGNLGLAIGPTIGGILFNNHLNLLFIIDALTTLLSAGLILFFIKVKDKVDNSLQKTETEQSELTNSNSIFSFLYNNPILVIFPIIMLVYNFCYIQWTFMLPLQIVDIFKSNGASFFSLLLSTNAIIVIILTPLLTSFIQKIEPLKSIFIGGVFYLSSFVLFAINKFMIIFILSIIIMTIGEILITINANHYIAKNTPKQYLGRSNSLLFVVSGTGYAVGPVVMGNIIILTSFKNAWLLVSAFMLCGVVSMYFLRRFEKINVLKKQILIIKFLAILKLKLLSKSDKPTLNSNK